MFFSGEVKKTIIAFCFFAVLWGLIDFVQPRVTIFSRFNNYIPGFESTDPPTVNKDALVLTGDKARKFIELYENASKESIENPQYYFFNELRDIFITMHNGFETNRVRIDPITGLGIDADNIIYHFEKADGWKCPTIQIDFSDPFLTYLLNQNYDYLGLGPGSGYFNYPEHFEYSPIEWGEYLYCYLNSRESLSKIYNAYEYLLSDDKPIRGQLPLKIYDLKDEKTPLAELCPADMQLYDVFKYRNLEIRLIKTSDVDALYLIQMPYRIYEGATLDEIINEP